jgi:hypothetical protein
MHADELLLEELDVSRAKAREKAFEETEEGKAERKEKETALRDIKRRANMVHRKMNPGCHKEYATIDWLSLGDDDERDDVEILIKAHARPDLALAIDMRLRAKDQPGAQADESLVMIFYPNLVQDRYGNEITPDHEQWRDVFEIISALEDSLGIERPIVDKVDEAAGSEKTMADVIRD